MSEIAARGFIERYPLHYREMAGELRALAEGAEPRCFSTGICHHMNCFARARWPPPSLDFFGLAEVLEWAWKTSEWYSGEDTYPVRHPHIARPEDAYDSSDDLWEGEYGRRRRDMCRHIAERIEELAKMVG